MVILELVLALSALVGASPQDALLQRWWGAWQSGAPLELSPARRCAEVFTAEFARSKGEGPAQEGLRALALDWLGLADSVESSAADSSQPPVGDPAAAATLRGAAVGLLRADRGAADWVLMDVLQRPERHPYPRRAAALRWALQRDLPGLSLALQVAARRLDDPLRPAALFALAQWAEAHGPDEGIDLFLVSLLGRDGAADVRPQPFGLIQERLRAHPAPLGARAAEALAERAQVMLRSPDWRQAARALQLLRGAEAERRVPLLLDALTLWHRRAQEAISSRRVEADIVAELESVSGRRLGANPGNWITWWVAVRQGRITLPGSPISPAPGGVLAEDDDRTRASFFGLRPTTDRVTFVIDHSGSMAASLGTRTTTRYEEAVAQMVRFLQACGPETRFNVILFDSAPLRSSIGLVAGSPLNIERARASMLARPPEGGTRLVPALRQALCLDANGDVDLDQLTADTVIVLCDGEIEEGAAWIGPLLARVQPDAQIRFHCVQVGPNGGGALRELAERTGGTFLRVDG